MGVLESLRQPRVLQLVGGLGVVAVTGLIAVSPSADNATLPVSGLPSTTVSPSTTEALIAQDELTFDSAAQPISTEVRLITSDTLTACVDSPYPPFAYSQQSDGEDLSGIDIDIITALATNNKLAVTFVETPFEGIFDALMSGKCDVIAAAVPVTPDRSRTYEFTNPYFRMSQSLLVRSADSSAFASVSSLRGKSVGVQRATVGSLHAKRLEAAVGITVQEFPGRFEMLNALRDAKIDVILGDVSANGFDAHESDGRLAVSGLLKGDEENYAFVVSPSNPVLAQTLNSSIQRVDERGLLRKIYVRHIGDALQRPVIG